MRKVYFLSITKMDFTKLAVVALVVFAVSIYCVESVPLRLKPDLCKWSKIIQ